MPTVPPARCNPTARACDSLLLVFAPRRSAQPPHCRRSAAVLIDLKRRFAVQYEREPTQRSQVAMSRDALLVCQGAVPGFNYHCLWWRSLYSTGRPTLARAMRRQGRGRLTYNLQRLLAVWAAYHAHLLGYLGMEVILWIASYYYCLAGYYLQTIHQTV
jgi:hypothetical protein